MVNFVHMSNCISSARRLIIKNKIFNITSDHDIYATYIEFINDYSYSKFLK